MNWSGIINTVVSGVMQALSHATTPGAPTATVPAPQEPVPAPVQTGGQNAPSEAVKAIQRLLAQFVDPSIKADGWLGPKTEQAIKDGIAKAQPYLSMFGINLKV